MKRRDFVYGISAALATSGWARSGQGQPAAPMAIDGLGEVHLDYPAALIDEMIGSGMRGCVITVGNPALQGPMAFADMQRELVAYDAHIAANASRFVRATTIADIDRARASNRIATTHHA